MTTGPRMDLCDQMTLELWNKLLQKEPRSDEITFVRLKLIAELLLVTKNKEVKKLRCMIIVIWDECEIEWGSD